MTSIKWWVAKDSRTNRYIQIEEAILQITKESEPIYECPQCGHSMVLRHGEINRPHFAHKGDSECTGGGEGANHWRVKTVLFEMLETTKQASVTNWDYTIHLEKSWGSTRPDISISMENSGAQFSIEVVDSHEPEQAVLEQWKDRMQIVRISGVDQDTIENLTVLRNMLFSSLLETRWIVENLRNNDSTHSEAISQLEKNIRLKLSY